MRTAKQYEEILKDSGKLTLAKVSKDGNIEYGDDFENTVPYLALKELVESVSTLEKALDKACLKLSEAFERFYCDNECGIGDILSCQSKCEDPTAWKEWCLKDE